jgi:hypothetical protein
MFHASGIGSYDGVSGGVACFALFASGPDVLQAIEAISATTDKGGK